MRLRRPREPQPGPEALQPSVSDALKKTQKDENPVAGEKILFYYNNNNVTQARGRPVPGQKPREMCGHDKKNDAGEDTFDDNELKNESAFSSQAYSVPLLPTGARR